MSRHLLFALPALLLTAGLSWAQSYSYSTYRPGDSSPQGYLRRETTPDTGAWIQSMNAGKAPREIQADMLAGDEYFQMAGGTRPLYVRQLYRDLIGREPLAPEVTYWVGRLSYQDRRDVASQLLRFHPQNIYGVRPVAPSYDPGYFPDPVSQTFPDPGGPYFRSPYFFNYQKSREISAFELGSQG
jgi:hypothetical protein